MASAPTLAGTRSTSLAGKYLTFILAKEEYGLAILKVREIIGLMDITPVPRTPDFIRGVINLRGKIIPVVDLRVKFAMPTAEQTELSCIIVLDIPWDDKTVQMGILVDAVSEVMNIDASNLEDTPNFGAGIDTSFIMGVGKIQQKVVMLLDVDKVLTNQEMQTVELTAKAA